MTNNDNLNDINQGIEIISKVMKAAGDNEKVKSSGKELGNAVLTVSKTINNALLPLAAVNFAFDKARIYFQEKFENDFTDKTKNIPEDCFIEPKASIAGPALQGLAFSHEEDELKDMYLNLLASAVDKRHEKQNHPSYVEIIRQLNCDEARILSGILASDIPQIPIIQLRDVKSARKYSVLQTYVLNIIDDETGEPSNMIEIVSMVENFIRLGLLTSEFGLEPDYPNMYDWVDNRPEFEHLKQMNKGKELNIQSTKGMLIITSFGRNFASAVNIKNT